LILTWPGWPEIFGSIINWIKDSKNKTNVKNILNLQKKKHKNTTFLGQNVLDKKKKHEEHLTPNPTTLTLTQTKYDQTKDINMLKIMQWSIIWHLFTLIIKESTWFDENEFRFKTKTLRLKSIKNLLLIQINFRLLTNQV